MFRNPSDKGAWGESLVCADLLKRGVHVYRAISPSAPCDLMALVDDKLARIEVKTVTMSDHPSVFVKSHESHDILALVFPAGEVHYYPSLDGVETVVVKGSRVHLL